MEDTRAQRVRQMLETGGAPAFYRTYMWQRAAAEARELQHNECQRCKRRGLYSPAEQVHHKTPLLRAPNLALAQSNLECLCKRCHEETHAEMDQGAGDFDAPPERW